MIKLLSIGNSFSCNSHFYLHKILESAGVVNLCYNLYIGGCSLEMHYNNSKTTEKPYIFYTNAITERGGDVMASLLGGLTRDKYDIITLQQASHFSGQKETYEPYLTEIINLVKKYQPQAKIYFYETWAYEIDSKHPCYHFYNNDQITMYKGILEAINSNVIKHNLPVIKAGELIQECRKEEPFNYKDGGKTLNKEDGFHLNKEGSYLIGLLWAKVMFNVMPNEVNFVPNEIEPKIAEYIKNKVTNFNN